MEQHFEESKKRESESNRQGDAASMLVLTTLQRYATGEISSRQAAKRLGPKATEHDVFAGIVAAHLPLPQPTPEELASQVAALRALYGPHWPHPNQ